MDNTASDKPSVKYMTHCKLHTKGGNFKDYELELDGKNLILSRP